MRINPIPSRDGEVAKYFSPEARATPWFNPNRNVIFINGMTNSGTDHLDSAAALSLLQMCWVVGVYNRSGGVFYDLAQCIADKYQFDGRLARTPEEAIARAERGTTWRADGSSYSTGLPATIHRARMMESVLERNPACLSLFQLLRLKEYRYAPIFAHSQGNLILSNALSAIRAVDGEAALLGREIRTFGSPTRHWPTSIRPIECGFTFDPVTWLAGPDLSFSISKVGMPPGSLNVITHSFAEYMKNDPAFVINRFRWGGWRATISLNLNEDGLADALINMGRNVPRVQSVFERLRTYHKSDFDDVALCYVERLRRLPPGNEVRQAVKKSSSLLALLTEAMEKGWTTSGENDAITFLKSL